MRGEMAVAEITQQPVTPEAFGALFEQHARAIANFLFRRTADWALAEDLTSVVFLEAWRRRDAVDLVGEPALPWLYGVAVNVLRNQRRSLRRHRAALERLPAPRDTPDFAEDAAPRLDDQRRMRDVLARMAGLSRADQEVLALCLWAEL